MYNLVKLINSKVKSLKAKAMWKKRRRRISRYKRTGKIKRAKVVWYKNAAFITRMGLIALVVGIISMISIIAYFSFTLPSPENVERTEGFSTQIKDRNGEVLYDIFADQKRTPIELSDVPEYLVQATVAIEDKNFFEHQGFDPLGMIRGLSRIVTRGYAQGGSTLTQQLVKNVLLSSERTVIRKTKEFLLTIQIEKDYSKEDILKMYLNEVPYGGTAWGVGAASEMYFGKDVKDLNLIESAFLAGLPQRPSAYSPYSSTPKAYMERTQQVLRRMREDGYIDTETEESAKEQLENLEFKGKGADFKAPHFVQYVQKILEEKYGQRLVEQGGLKVTTTLDLDLQEKAQEIVSEEIEKVEQYDISNGAAVIIDPQNGEILAMVGSKDFNDPDYDGQVNVTVSLRQPGSAIKPITYVTGLKKGYTASTLLMDVPTEFPGGVGNPAYKPENYDGQYRGPVQFRYALANSINVPAVKMLALVGVKEVLSTAYDMGLTSLEPTQQTLSRVGLSLTLGGGEVRLLELTNAYSAFMNTGLYYEPVSILKVEDRNGKVLEEKKQEKGKRVLSEEEAFIMSDILSDDEARSAVFGAGSLLNIPGRQVAVKTGTTNDKRDNWTIGGNPQIVVGVWVGNNDNSVMKKVASGVTGASPIWRKLAIAGFEGKSVVSFPQPSSIVTAAVDKVSGYAAHDGFESRNEFFVPGTEPGLDPIHLKIKVCKSDGKLASPSDVASGNYEEREYFKFTEKDPTAGSGEVNKWQEGINAWISEQGNDKYFPPTDYCSGGNPVNVEFRDPSDRANNLPSKFGVRLSADSTSKIIELRVEVDGVRVRSFDNPPYEFELDLGKGSYELRAIAKDERGNESDRKIYVGVGQAWDYAPSPTPTPTILVVSPTPIPSPTPTI